MNPLINLAKTTVENYIEKKEIILTPNDFPREFLEERAGTFITIKKGWKLRACVGTYLPTKENIAEEVISNAITAATKDYRFGPIEKEELDYLSYTVYILGELEIIEKLENLNPRIYGILVRTDLISPEEKNVLFNGQAPFKSGLLLPDLKNINTPEEQFYAACQKAGINPEKEKVILYRFPVKKYEQENQKEY